MVVAALNPWNLPTHPTLTHTPSPMRFLNEVLGRPDSERPFLILVTGYPAEQVTIPDMKRKTLGEIATFYE